MTQLIETHVHMRHGSCMRDMTHAHYSFIFMTLEHQALCQWRHTYGVSKEQRKSARRNGRKEEDWNTGKRDQRYHQGSSTLFPRADSFWDSGSGQPENCGRGVGAGRGAHAERGERRRAVRQARPIMSSTILDTVFSCWLILGPEVSGGKSPEAGVCAN